MKRTTLGWVAMILAIAAAIYFAVRRGKGNATGNAAASSPWAQLEENQTVLPTGMTITPQAAAGAYFVPLNPGLADFPQFVAGQPVTTAMSPDGETLLVLTSGYNRMDGPNGRREKADSNEYLFVFDISQGKPRKTQVLQVPDTFDGVAWNPNGTEFYVSGGVDDDVHVYGKDGGGWKEAEPPISLGHKEGLGIRVKPEAAGLAVTADGKRLVVANFENDTVSLIDLAARKMVAELDLRPGKINPKDVGVAGGEYPFWVVTKGNDEAYVSCPRDRQIVVVDLSGEPKVTGRIEVGGQPNKMILDHEGKYLYAAIGTDDFVAVIDTATNKMVARIGTTAPKTIFANPQRLMGSNPNSLALSPDEKTLYVTNGGANSIAVIHLAGGTSGDATGNSVAGLIPTGWNPSSVSVSKDGGTLYVVNLKSVPGPNPQGCRNTTAVGRGAQNPCNAQNQYILQLDKGGFEVMPTPDEGELGKLTDTVAQDDHYVSDAKRAADAKMMAFLRQHIHHVIYIVKENRTYDQVLGDLPEGNGDPRLALFGEALTPNQHQLAEKFVDLDNFYDSGDVSGDGWNWSTSARATNMVENTIAMQYADRGLTYDFEGEDRNINVGFATLAERHAANPKTPDDKDLLPGTADVDAPDGPGGEENAGYLWDAALRARLSLRNYGFFLDLDGYDARPGQKPLIPLLRDPYATKTRVAFPVKAALMSVTDPYFRGFDLNLPDYWRFTEWNREFQGYVASGKVPNLEFVRFMRDHLGQFETAIDGTGTVEDEVADDDYAVGRLVETIAHSKIADSTLVFIIEDDAQNGPDHVDAHRSTAYIVGAYVKQGAVVSTHYTTVNMLKTIEDVLGMGPMGINDDVMEPMADVFTTEAKPWTFTSVVPAVLRSTKLPVPGATSGTQRGAYATPKHDSAYWAAKTKGMDFSVEDHIDSAKFNRIIWHGLKGKDVPYPTARSGRNLRKNRKELLRGYANEWSEASSGKRE